MIVSAPPRESLLRAVRNFPAAPMILARLGRMLGDMDSSIDDVTVLLKCDAALSARILRIANSAMYNSGEPCASLDEAVLRVGFTELYRLTGFAATVQIIEQRLVFYGISAAQFRENALLTALIMEELAGAADLDRPAAYTVGLLRSIGKIALDRWVQGQGATFAGVNYVDAGDGVLPQWETATVGLTNCEAAAIIMGEWLFPAATIEAIRDHYRPTDESQMANLLNLAAGAADRCGHGLPGESSCWNPSPEQYAAAGVTAEWVDDAMRSALEAFGPVRASVA